MMIDVKEKTRLCLYFSQAAYEQQTIRVNECEAFMTRAHGAQYVAFRGTEAGGAGLSDWVANLIKERGIIDILRDIRAVPWKNSRVGWSHAGFLKGAKGCVDHGLRGLLRKDQPIWLTGHSLGGALALNAAALLHSMGFDVAGVITFGAPRTFLKGTAERWAGEFCCLQYSNASDPVPDHPWRLWGYRQLNEVSTGFDGGHGLDDYKQAVLQLK